MEYISHEDYKKMMENFSKGTPKQSLNEAVEQGLKKESFNDYEDDDQAFVEMLSDELTHLYKVGKITRQQHDDADDYLNDHGYELWAQSQEPRDFHALGYLLSQVGVDVEGIEEGNAFTAGLAKAKKGEEFKVDGKSVKDTSNYDASVKEEWGSPYDGGADDLAAMAKDDMAKDTHGAAYNIGDQVSYGGHSFTIMIGAGGTAVLKHSSGKMIPHEQSMEILKQAAIDKKFGNVDEYQFDQMYPDDPGPFEGMRYTDPDSEDFELAVAEYIESEDLTPEQMKAALDYLEQHSYHLQGDFANTHEVGGGTGKAARYVINLAKQQNPDIDTKINEFLMREDDVNWDRMDDEEAEENETDNGIEESKDMEEGLNPAPFQATGPTIQTVEEKHNLSKLAPQERDQLKQYVETIRTVKEEISKMLSKTKMKEGGDMTNLVMKPSTVSEDGGHDSMENSLGEKLHSAFSKVTDMAIKQLVADGWDESQAASFLKVEIEERAKEAVNAQYDPH